MSALPDRVQASDRRVVNARDALRSEKIQSWQQERLAVVYVRQSSPQQVVEHQESTRLQYGLTRRADDLGWPESRIVVIVEDLGKSGASTAGRQGFQRLVTEVSLDRVGLILGVEMSRPIVPAERVAWSNRRIVWSPGNWNETGRTSCPRWNCSSATTNRHGRRSHAP
jgi:hypothetical protein